MSCKREGLLITLRHEKGRPFRSHNTLRQRSYDIERTAFPPISYSPTLTNPQSTCEIYGLGMIGLGRMGAHMVRKVLKGGHECVVFDRSPNSVEELVQEKALGSDSFSDLVKKLEGP